MRASVVVPKNPGSPRPREFALTGKRFFHGPPPEKQLRFTENQTEKSRLKTDWPALTKSDKRC